MEIYTEVSHSDHTSYSCILFKDKIAIYFLNFHIKGDTCYIDKLDSTGYTKKYESDTKNKYSSRDFVLSLLNKYCRHCRIIFCFSLSSPIYVFNNTKKLIIKNLTDYWTEIFKIYNINNKIYTLTTSSKNHLRDIYKSTDDIVRFEDEPVSKILQEGRLSLGRVYEILSCRSDFMKGALIYSVNENSEKRENENSEKRENENSEKRENENIEKRENESRAYESEEKKSEIKSEETNSENEAEKESDIKEILQNLNFEGDGNIEKSSKYLVEKLDLVPFDLKIYKRIKKEVKEKENITVLKVKRRK